MNQAKLAQVAQYLCQPGKGILAADESGGTIEKRFKTINLTSTETNRKAWRELLFTTPGINRFISGVILYDETIRQGLGKILQDKGILVGIKVDQGLNAAMITEGLLGLKERLMEYIKLGAVFTKWRAVITIGGPDNLEENASRLAEYAKVTQAVGLVPIVEPEVLMDGDHNLARCEQVTGEVLKKVFAKLKEKEVLLTGMLLKPNMVLPGKDCPDQAEVSAVAEATLRCFKRWVPEVVPGVVFLSGGLSPDEATQRLRVINQRHTGPGQMSFSFGRALQQEALPVWGGKAENKAAAQKAFYDRAVKVAQARKGQL